MKGFEMKGLALAILFIVVVLVLFGLGGLITLWSLNAVFGLNIAYNLATWFGTLWFGTLWLGGIVAGTARSQTK